MTLPFLVDANELAERLSVSPDWIRRHADELGAIKLGGGDRPRLRFDPVAVEQAIRHPEPEPPAQIAPARQRRRASEDDDLIPLRGKAA